MDVELGRPCRNDSKRDAIHVAVAPVVAAEQLKPGQHVGFIDDESVRVAPAKENIGVVDPFLKREVKAGETIWLILYPGTITALRHDWTHPAFAQSAEPTRADVEASKQWIADFAASIRQDYESIMEAAERFDVYGDWTYDNSESYKDRWDDFEEFWHHYSVVTGKNCEHDSGPFTCSC